MFNITKFCTLAIGKNNALKSLSFRHSLYTYASKPTIRDKALLLMKRNDVCIQRNLLKQGNVLAVRFASKSTQNSDKTVGKWMLTCSGMVFVAVVLGIIGYLFFYYQIRDVVKLIVDKTYGK